jgi:HAD superfamily hydrolase (TIGR01509 family)
MRFAEFDAVTIDAFGTLVTLTDPLPELERELRARGVERERDAIARAFAVEGEYYRLRGHEGHNEASLADLRQRCVRVFLEALDVDLSPAEFVEPYISALRFELLPGAREGVETLRRRGLALAVVSNWDLTLPRHLGDLGLGGILVVTSAEVVPKPAPAIFRRALERLRVKPERSLHIGDNEADAQGAAAAGLHFAPAPLTSALEALV